MRLTPEAARVGLDLHNLRVDAQSVGSPQTALRTAAIAETALANAAKRLAWAKFVGAFHALHDEVPGVGLHPGLAAAYQGAIATLGRLTDRVISGRTAHLDTLSQHANLDALIHSATDAFASVGTQIHQAWQRQPDRALRALWNECVQTVAHTLNALEDGGISLDGREPIIGHDKLLACHKNAVENLVLLQGKLFGNGTLVEPGDLEREVIVRPSAEIVWLRRP